MMAINPPGLTRIEGIALAPRAFIKANFHCQSSNFALPRERAERVCTGANRYSL